MQLHCPTCGSAVPAEDVNLATTLAKCRRCNAIFDIKPFLSAEQRQGPRAGVRGPSAIKPLPAQTRIRVEEFAGTLTLTWRWFRFIYIFLAFFCVAWDGFLVFWYSMAFTQRGAPWLMIVFPVAHVAVGIGLTYTVITGFLNSTRVSVNSNELTVKHFPLPWIGNRTIPANQIAQLFCEQKIGQNNSRNSSGPSISYNLYAVLKDRTKIKIAGGFTEPDEPRLLEEKIEERLKIQDQPVVGEYSN